MNENYPLVHHAVQRKLMHYSPNLLNTLSNSIDNRKLAFVEYDSPERGISKRLVEPMAVVYIQQKRHLIGWCRLRNDYRAFRLDRLNCIKLLREEFIRRGDFRIEDFQDDMPRNINDEYEGEE